MRRKKEQFSSPVVIDLSSGPNLGSYVYKVSFSNNTFSMSNEASHSNIIAIFPSSSNSYYVLDNNLNLSDANINNVVKVDTVGDTSYILKNTGDVFLLSNSMTNQLNSTIKIVDIAALSDGLCAVDTKGDLYYTTNNGNDFESVTFTTNNGNDFESVTFNKGKIQKIKSNHENTIYIKTKENEEFSSQLNPQGNFTELDLNQDIFNDESDVFVGNNKISLNSDNKMITITNGYDKMLKFPIVILCFNAIKRNNDIIDIYIVTNQEICGGEYEINIDNDSTLIQCKSNCAENKYKQLQGTGGTCAPCPDEFPLSDPNDNDGIQKCKCVLCDFLNCDIFSSS